MKLNNVFQICLKNNLSFLPLVFLDESQKTKNIHFMRDYKTMRKIIRNIGLIPVFMGTNASLINFISKDSAGGSRTGDETSWSYLVYKLTNPLSSFILKEKNQILEAIKKCKIKKTNIKSCINDPKKQFKDFVEQVTNLLKYERQFFCNIVFEYLPK